MTETQILSGFKASVLFQQAFAMTIGQEGGLNTDPADPGNWTGGAVGHGLCVGTKWGISAASFPLVPITRLSEADAQSLYYQHYWAALHGDALPGALAMLAFDAGVNNGIARTALWLQEAASVPADGILGPGSLNAIAVAAAAPGDLLTLLCEFQARRLDFMARLPDWPRFGLGWSRRLNRVFAQALEKHPLCKLPLGKLPASV